MTVKANFKTILLIRDPMTKTAKVVAPWEVPAYRSAFGDESIQILDGDTVVELDELPDPTEEFSRMRALFGTEAETKQSHIDIVYGRGKEGIRELAAAIKASVAGDVEAAQSVVDKANGVKVDAGMREARQAAYVDEVADPLASVAEAPKAVAKSAK